MVGRTRNRSFGTSRGAFTLLEVTLVVAIVVLMAAIAVPSIDNLYGEVRLDAGADLVRARFTDARAAAVEEGRAYRFAIQPGADGFRIAPDRDDFWSGNDNTAEDENGVKPVIREDKLPKGITFSNDAGSSGGDASGGWTRLVTFLPDGSCREDRVEITFNGQGLVPVVLKLRGLTGTVSVRSQAKTEAKP